MASQYMDSGIREKPVPQSFLTKLYNRNEGTVFGRTGQSWLKIIIFYIVFYIALSILFGFSFFVFYQTVDPRIPKYQLSSSLIGTNPGLGFRPMPDKSNVESSLIYYKGTDEDSYNFWTKSLTEFLLVYKEPGRTPGRGEHMYQCSYTDPPPSDKVCDVNVRNWHPCTAENNFNYHVQSPCIFLKLNKIYGWTPEFYNDSNKLPNGMPSELSQHIRAVHSTSPEQMNTVWVSCEGENPADVENLGKVNYYPQQGFPGYFYPYKNTEGYLAPIMAIQIERPRTGILINIQCKAWAKNIKHSTYDKTGLVHFELMID